MPTVQEIIRKIQDDIASLNRRSSSLSGELIDWTNATEDFKTSGSAHIGDAVNYAEIKNDGEINLHGTARVLQDINVVAPQWAKGASAPTEDFVGIFPVLKFDAGHNDEAHFALIVPHKLALGSSINVSVDWCYTGAPDAGTVCWKIDYKAIEPGEAVAGGETTIIETSPGGHTSGQLVHTEFSTEILGAVIHDVLGIKFWRDSGVDTMGADAQMIQIHFMMLVDKLGEPT